MSKPPDTLLTPPQLFQRGIETSREIHNQIVDARAYYLGRSARCPDWPLSEIFNPSHGPILRFFVQTIRTINRTRFIGRYCRSAAFKEFRQESAATLEELRVLAIQLAMCLGSSDGADRRHSVGQALKFSVYFFRVANGRFFRQLSWHGSILHLLLKNSVNEGAGIYVADRLLNDIAKAFEARERQLRGESAAVEHSFFTHQLDRIEEKIDNLPRLLQGGAKTSQRYKVPVKVAAAAMGISRREVHRILNRQVAAPDGFPGLDDELRFCSWVSNYRKRRILVRSVTEM